MGNIPVHDTVHISWFCNYLRHDTSVWSQLDHERRHIGLQIHNTHIQPNIYKPTKFIKNTIYLNLSFVFRSKIYFSIILLLSRIQLSFRSFGMIISRDWGIHWRHRGKYVGLRKWRSRVHRQQRRVSSIAKSNGWPSKILVESSTLSRNKVK